MAEEVGKVYRERQKGQGAHEALLLHGYEEPGSRSWPDLSRCVLVEKVRRVQSESRKNDSRSLFARLEHAASQLNRRTTRTGH